MNLTLRSHRNFEKIFLEDFCEVPNFCAKITFFGDDGVWRRTFSFFFLIWFLLLFFFLFWFLLLFFSYFGFFFFLALSTKPARPLAICPCHEVGLALPVGFPFLAR